MPICTEKELPEKARTLWQKAKSAAEVKNYGYAMSLLQTVLKESPGFLDGRKALRKIAISQNGKKKAGGSLLSGGGMKSSLMGGLGGSAAKKDPLAAMENAEKTLEGDPFNTSANHLLKEAALLAGYPEIAVLCLDTLMMANAKDT
mgnify:CR=1 FL=1